MSHEDDRTTPLEPQLAASLRALSESGLEPERDLWPGLERRIAKAHHVRRPARRYAAAAAVLFGSVAAILWMLADPKPTTGLESLVSSRLPAQVPQSSSAGFQQAFRSYLDERDRTLGLVAEQLQDYPPEVRDEIRRSIEVIERAMREIEASLAAAAPDPAAEARLMELYAFELRLVRVVNERLRGSPDGGV